MSNELTTSDIAVDSTGIAESDLIASPLTDIMIDLETMGTDPYSPVVGIGAVRFNAGDINSLRNIREENTFYQPIKLESCMQHGLKPSASTILWWLTDPSVTAEARALFTDLAAVQLAPALDAFTDWHQSGMETLWGNSARFDLGLLSDCYRVLDKPLPWLHWNEGCYRTMKQLPATRHIRLVRAGTHHNAFDDAVSQAEHLCRIVSHLGAYTALPLPTTNESI
jgi:exodeoxyribonuclease VIII